MTLTAVCACGRLEISVESEPRMVATCHCDFCQRRTGSVFQVAAYFASDEPMEIRGETNTYNGLEIDGVGNDAGGSVTYRFCPTCGSTVYWTTDGEGGSLGIAVGNIVGRDLPVPGMELYTNNRHGWVPAVAGAEQF
ncbi:MAG TPA: GFA family protein [Acidimicrobiales bacterium]|nr:GFA family protein [Acidimicrobiales bacterium]